MLRQKEEAQRVVVHLRSLIDGQAHHMEHIVRSLSRAPELSDYAEDDGSESMTPREQHQHQHQHQTASEAPATPVRRASLHGFRRTESRAYSRASTADGQLMDAEGVQPELERRLFGSPLHIRPGSQMSLTDVADRHLQDKTDAIADIIRNISEQCAAAVEGLHLSRGVDAVPEPDADKHLHRGTAFHSDEDEEYDHHHTNGVTGRAPSTTASDAGENDGDSRLLTPHGGSSPYPPTPDLVHRSSTSMSINSQSTTPERHSQQFADLPTKIVEDDDEAAAAAAASSADEGAQHVGQSLDADDAPNTSTRLGKHPSSAPLIRRPAGARISALGQA